METAQCQNVSTGGNIMDGPQCLIDSGPDGKLVVRHEVLDQLKKLDKQVVSVGIAGPYRTGKSYLMNRLAGRKKETSRLGNHKQFLTEQIGTCVPDMIANLQRHGFDLPLHKIQHINNHRDDKEKAIELLNVVDVEEEDNFKVFVACLRELKLGKPADVVEKGTVAIDVEVFVKNFESVDTTLLCKLNDLAGYRGRSQSKVKQEISKLKENDIQILEVVLLDGSLKVWMWCRSTFGVNRMKDMNRTGELLRLLTSVFNCLHKTVEPTHITLGEDHLERTTGFALGKTVQSETKGIWIWVRDHPKHPDRYLVLLDTEGLGDMEKGDENNDNQILCLTLLLTSTFVYNVTGVIDNNAIQKLHFITEIAKHVHIRSNTDPSGSDSDADLYFPEFVYVLRDFFLSLEFNGKEVDKDDYLEHALSMKPGSDENVKTFNKIRECIRIYFKKRKCFTFGRPVNDQKKMQCLDQVHDDELCTDFQDETELFLDYVYSKSPVKQINGRMLSGSMLGSLVEVYVEQMKTGMPYVENAVDTMAQIENKKAREEAVAFYSSKMRQSLQMPVLYDSEFSRCHNDCLQQAIEVFLSKSVFDKDQEYQKTMNREIEEKYKELFAMNEKMSKERCLEQLRKLYQSVENKLRNGSYARRGGYMEYKNDMARIQDQCIKQMGQLGVKMRSTILEFFVSKQVEEQTILRADQQVTESERIREAEHNKAMEMERQKVVAERARAVQEQMLRDQQVAHQENSRRLEDRLRQDAANQLDHLQQTMARRLDEQNRLHREGLAQQAASFNAHISQLRQQIANQQDALNSRHNDDGGGGGWCSVM